MDAESEMNRGPELAVDLGIAHVLVQGGPNDDLGDVQSVFRDEVEYVIENVEKLKRLDFELVDEYEDDSESDASGRTFG